MKVYTNCMTILPIMMKIKIKYKRDSHFPLIRNWVSKALCRTLKVQVADQIPKPYFGAEILSFKDNSD